VTPSRPFWCPGLLREVCCIALSAAGLLIVGAAPLPVHAQTTMTAEEARAEARTLGSAAREASKGLALDPQASAQIPGYQAGIPDQTRYYDAPETMPDAGAAAAHSSEAYRTANSTSRPRVDVKRSDLARAAAIEKDPQRYAGSTDLGGTSGNCTKLPPGADRPSTAEYTCNIGKAVVETEGTCTSSLVLTPWNEKRYNYLCSGSLDETECPALAGNAMCTRTARTVLSDYKIWLETWTCGAKVDALGLYLLNTEPNPPPADALAVSNAVYRCNRSGLADALALDPTGLSPPQRVSGLNDCTPLETARQCTSVPPDRGGLSPRVLCKTWSMIAGMPTCTEKVPEEVYACSSDLAGLTAEARTSHWFTQGWGPYTCLGDTGTCTQGPETCGGAGETRVVGGSAITRPCWQHSKALTCQSITAGNSDCASLAQTPGCTLSREICLDDPLASDGTCAVKERVYTCPIPGGTTAPPQYLCGGDVYCIDGHCETVTRDASDEFKDAVVAVNALGQANAEFNESSLTLFQGTRDTCSHKLFGLSNCCSGSGVPILTPWLCSAAEQLLDKKDDAGLCHKLGTYCSSKILGICVTRKDAYCCFQSKISRILQEQGRPQIDKPWASPKDETCPGFTVYEFQKLDLAAIDFSEVYAEFMEAAKLPDEAAALVQIKQRITDYVAAHGN